MRRIVANADESQLQIAAAALRRARQVVALTGAGISVASGIADFRSPGGLWSRFSPDEYATLEVFYRDPAKAWQLYRALGTSLAGKQPNPAHLALAELEQAGLLAAIITQNIDSLHQQAGSRTVYEIHGDHRQLQCLRCGLLTPVQPAHYQSREAVCCPECGFPLKPNVVLFGEEVRDLDAIHAVAAACDLLLVIGTSAQVYPAAALPEMVLANSGRLFEFNREPTLEPLLRLAGADDHFFFHGDAALTLPLLARACLQR